MCFHCLTKNPLIELYLQYQLQVTNIRKLKPFYKYVQLLFPFFVSIAFFSTSVFGLPFLVLGLWKCGFPENVCCIIQAYRVAREEPLEAFCHVCDGLGGFMHHTATAWCCCALASTYYTYDYRVLALVLPPVAQHWVVIIKVRGSTFL